MKDPKKEALAFRIWAFCEPRGWDVTSAEIGEEFGMTAHHVGAFLRGRGWSNRIRRTHQDPTHWKSRGKVFGESLIEDLHEWS